MLIVFRFAELKLDKKKSEVYMKRYEDLMKEHAMLEKVSRLYSVGLVIT